MAAQLAIDMASKSIFLFFPLTCQRFFHPKDNGMDHMDTALKD